jgi:DNA-binding transcriptional regulator YiaG
MSTHEGHPAMTDPVPGLTVYAITMEEAKRLPGPQREFDQGLHSLRSSGPPVVGPTIRRMRMRLGFDLTEFADMVGIPANYLSQVESGRIAYPSPHMPRISLFLNTSVENLLFDARRLEAIDEAA